MFLKRGEVHGGAIPFVPAKLIVRKQFVQRKHGAVPFHFGDNAGGRDAEAEGIPFDDCLLGPWEILHGKPVNEDHVRLWSGEGSDGPPHGQMGSPQDVQAVDLRHLRHAAQRARSSARSSTDATSPIEPLSESQVATVFRHPAHK